MNLKAWVAAAASFLAGASGAHAQAPSPAASRVAAVDALFRPWSTRATPGCAVSVVQGAGPALERAYGMADLEHDTPNTTATVFEAGSVAKQFTAAAILMLVQDGRLRLDDDIRRHLPELPDFGRVITVNQLLTHTHGLTDWGLIAARNGAPRGTRVYTQADVFDIVRAIKAPEFEPGTQFAYGNTGYNLLTEIVARSSGRSLAEFTRTRIFVPLNMRSTSWRDDFRRVVKGRAIAYEPAGTAAWRQHMPFENTYGHGGLLTTVGDLQRWNAALGAERLGRFVTGELQRRGRLTNGQEIAYARGFFVQSHRNATEIAHAGSTAGYRSWLGRYPEQRLSIVVLCNAANVPAEALARGVADLYLPRSAAPPAAATTPPPDSVSRGSPSPPVRSSSVPSSAPRGP